MCGGTIADHPLPKNPKQWQYEQTKDVITETFDDLCCVYDLVYLRNIKNQLKIVEAQHKDTAKVILSEFPYDAK